MRRLIAGMAMTAALCGGPALADAKLTAEAEAYAVNNAYSALYHEFGHLFVDQYELPILGGEEYIADAIATLFLLKADDDASVTISYDTVDGYLKSSELYGETDPGTVDFNDAHGLDVQRAYQMTCLLVGGAPEDYGDLADQVGLDEERQDACADEFDTATRGWDKLMAGHLRAGGSAGARLSVVYETGTGEYGKVEDLLKRDKVLETVAAAVEAEFVLTRPATLKATTCGEENAFYDPDTSEVSICYEYVQFYYDLIADPDNAGMDDAE